MPLFNSYKARVLDHINGVTVLTPEAHLHLATSTTTPTAAAANITEPTGNSYSRIEVANDATIWDAASSGTADNGTALTWAKATGNQGTQTYVVAYAADNTTPIYYAPIAGDTGIAITTNEQLSIPAADFDWTLT